MAHDPLDANDLSAIAKEEEGYFTILTPDGRKITEHPALAEILAGLARLEAGLKLPVNVSVDLDKLAAAIVAKLPAGTTLTAADIAVAVANEQARRLAS